MFAMAYTILKCHRKALLKMGMDELLEFLQKTMEADFGYDDDFVIEVALKENLAELRSSRLHTAGQSTPDNEKPQKPFGLHNYPSVEEEAAMARRAPFSEKERLFSEETVRRGEEQSRRLALVNSQTSIDDGSIASADDQEDTRGSKTPSLPPSPHPISRDQDELDDSLQLLMRQASLEDGGSGSQRRVDERRTTPQDKEVRRIKESRRPASAEPTNRAPGRKGDDKRGGGGGGGKRASAYGTVSLEQGRRSESKTAISSSRASTSHLDTSRTSRTSSEVSSRVLNTSVDSATSLSSKSRSKEVTPSRRSYYYGEQPEIGNGGQIEGAEDDEEITPVNEEKTIVNGVVRERGGGGVREHEGEVVRIRVPFSSSPAAAAEENLTQNYNIERLAAQQISPRYNGHKVTIQVNRGQERERLDTSYSSEPPSSPATRHLSSSNRVSESQASTRRQMSTSEKKVSGRTETHTATHSLYVSEHREQSRRREGRAPLAQQQDLEPEEATNGTSRHRHSLNESYSSSSEGETRLRTQRHSSSTEFRETAVLSDVSDFRKETFF